MRRPPADTTPMRPAPASEEAGGDAPAEELLSVGSAARLLGVSVSSLRAWAAAGQVPHRRTRGGHRRFRRAELERWLAERGGELPVPDARPSELVASRVAALPEVAREVRRRRDGIVAEALLVLGERGPASRRRVHAREERLQESLGDLADALEAGDLGPCLRESEWHGFRHGAAGRSVDQPLGEALALARAVEIALAPRLEALGPADARAVRQALDRASVRIVTGYAAGLRSRRRAGADG